MEEKTTQNTEFIHIFDFLKIIWNGKSIIVIAVLISLLFGNIYLSSKTPQYESKIIFELASEPPFYKNRQVQSDFKKLFYLSKSYESWVNKTNNPKLLLSDIMSEMYDNDGNLRVVTPNPQIKVLVGEKKISPGRIFINTNDSEKLNDIYSYSKHVNMLLSKSYVSRALTEMKMRKALYKDFGVPEGREYDRIVGLDRYINSISGGSSVLDVQYPSAPIKTAPKKAILVIFIFLGLIFGFLYVFFRHEYNKYKRNIN